MRKMSQKCYFWSLGLVLFVNLAGKFPVVGERQYAPKELEMKSGLQRYELTGHANHDFPLDGFDTKGSLMKRHLLEMKNNGSKNGSNPNPPPVRLSRGENLSFTLGYSVILIVGLSGNFLIILVIAANREFHNNLNALLCNLVVADVLRMLTSVSFELFMINKIGDAVSNIPADQGASGRIFCKSMFALPPLFTFAFVFTLIFMTFERFVAVVYPFKSVVFKNKSKWIIFVVWLASIVLEMPGLCAFNSIRTPGGDHICAIDFSPRCDGNIIEDTKCNSKTFKDFLSVCVYLTFVIAFLFILSLHVMMVIMLYKNRAQFHPESSRVSRNPTNSTRDVVRMLGVVSVVYVLTSLPSQIYQFGYIYDNAWLSRAMPVYFNFLLIFIENSHSMIYPWIYAFFVRRFRVKYAKLFRGCFLRNKRRSHSDASTKSGQATTMTHDSVRTRMIRKNSNETKF